MRSRLALTVLAVLHAAASSMALADDTPSTWTKAVVYLPNSTVPTTIDSIPNDRKLPVLVYMHGCSGIGGNDTDNHRWAKLLSAQGLLVVMPDGMARGDRKMMSCDSSIPQADRRLAELKYAAAQAKAQPWFDGKLLLMGWSEGGVAVARTALPGIAGAVITGWTCTSSSNTFNGVFAPRQTPVLAVNYVDDPTFPYGGVNSGSCEPKLAGRPASKVVMLPGKGHGTYDNANARDAVLNFVADRLASPVTSSNGPSAAFTNAIVFLPKAIEPVPVDRLPSE